MVNDIHVIPIGDVREHYEHELCWCAPTRDEEEPSVLIHHAADMRERFESDRADIPEKVRA